MAKQRFMFQVEFNLDVRKGETIDLRTLTEFKRALTEFVKQGYEEVYCVGGLLVAHDEYTRDVRPSAVKVRMVDTSKI